MQHLVARIPHEHGLVWQHKMMALVLIVAGIMFVKYSLGRRKIGLPLRRGVYEMQRPMVNDYGMHYHEYAPHLAPCAHRLFASVVPFPM